MPTGRLSTFCFSVVVIAKLAALLGVRNLRALQEDLLLGVETHRVATWTVPRLRSRHSIYWRQSRAVAASALLCALCAVCSVLLSFPVVHLLSLLPRTHGWVMPRKPFFRTSVPLKIISNLRQRVQSPCHSMKLVVAHRRAGTRVHVLDLWQSRLACVSRHLCPVSDVASRALWLTWDSDAKQGKVSAQMNAVPRSPPSPT